MIARYDTVDAVYKEAQKTFKWDLGQAKAAIDPLIKRYNKQ